MSKFYLPVDLGPLATTPPISQWIWDPLPQPTTSQWIWTPSYKPHPHLLRDLELSDHAQLVVHLDATFDQLQLCALQIREVELIDVELGGPWQHFLLWEGLWG